MVDEILLEKNGKVAIITFNLEKKLNALNAPLYYKLGAMMNDIAKMDDIYITVITGKGRYFSACVAGPTSMSQFTN
jgi:peroxisomal 3,2-trans-enoyl-CoA isomerase